MIRLLSSPGAIEREIARLLTESIWASARALIAAGAQPPQGADLWDQAVRRCYAQLQADRRAAELAERQREYEETDEVLRRIKAGEEVVA